MFIPARSHACAILLKNLDIDDCQSIHYCTEWMLTIRIVANTINGGP